MISGRLQNPRRAFAPTASLTESMCMMLMMVRATISKSQKGIIAAWRRFRAGRAPATHAFENNQHGVSGRGLWNRAADSLHRRELRLSGVQGSGDEVPSTCSALRRGCAASPGWRGHDLGRTQGVDLKTSGASRSSTSSRAIAREKPSLSAQRPVGEVRKYPWVQFSTRHGFEQCSRGTLKRVVRRGAREAARLMTSRIVSIDAKP